MEGVQFDERTMRSSVSLPLGSLRIANRFRLTDLPTTEDVHGAYEFVHATLAAAGVPRLSDGDMLVGSGGYVRLLSHWTVDLWTVDLNLIRSSRYTVTR